MRRIIVLIASIAIIASIPAVAAECTNKDINASRARWATAALPTSQCSRQREGLSDLRRVVLWVGDAAAGRSKVRRRRANSGSA
jgi:hypothetical protein